MKKLSKLKKAAPDIKPKKRKPELIERQIIREVKPGQLLARVEVSGEPLSPVNQYKARAIKRGKFWTAMMYMDSKFDKYKESFIESVLEQYTGPTYSCTIRVEAEFRFGTKRRKDLPNAGKLEFDALSGIIYVDDSQIAQIQTKKVYSKENPGCTISVFADEESVWAID
jgi:Holliday junction resolvase RusA-like endonuclease